jgi:4-hydroxybenzoate polyprenyltransferase
VRKLLSLLSWRNWGIFRYNSIWQNLAALFYIALVEELFSLAFIGLVLLFTAFSTLMTGFGYLVNDLADREVDLSQGKGNAFASVGTLTAVLVVLGALGVGIFLGWPFMAQPWFSVLWLLWVLCAVFYSLPPLRLKERGLPGLVVTIAAQQTLPTAMLFAIFGQLFSPGALVFVLFATVRGISSDVSHQMRDAEADRASGIKTFAVHRGEAAVQMIYAVSLELERLFLGAVYILLLVELPGLRIPWDFWLSLGWPLFLFYLPLFVLTVGSSLRALRQDTLRQHDPYNELRQMNQRDTLHVIHHTLPTVLTPLYLGLLLSIAYWPNLIFLVVLFMLYGLYSPSRWADTWPLRSLLAYQRGLRSRS